MGAKSENMIREWVRILGLLIRFTSIDFFTSIHIICYFTLFLQLTSIHFFSSFHIAIHFFSPLHFAIHLLASPLFLIHFAQMRLVWQFIHSLDFDFPDLDNCEQIFDSHISQTFLNLLGGSEKDTIQSNMNEESVVMATPRRRRVEPEIEKDLEAKSDKVAEMKENPGLEFVIVIWLVVWLQKRLDNVTYC